MAIAALVVSSQPSTLDDIRAAELDKQRLLRRGNVVSAAEHYQQSAWNLAVALAAFNDNKDWAHDLSYDQTRRCGSLAEWLDTYERKLKFSKSWAEFLARLPGLKASLIEQVKDRPEVVAEIDDHIRQTDPSRIQDIRHTLTVEIAAMQNAATAGDPAAHEQAVNVAREVLSVAHHAMSRKDVRKTLQLGRGIVTRTIYRRVSSLPKKMREMLEITDVPLNAIVPITTTYNPAKQEEYQRDMATRRFLRIDEGRLKVGGQQNVALLLDCLNRGQSGLRYTEVLIEMPKGTITATRADGSMDVYSFNEYVAQWLERRDAGIPVPAINMTLKPV